LRQRPSRCHEFQTTARLAQALIESVIILVPLTRSGYMCGSESLIGSHRQANCIASSNSCPASARCMKANLSCPKLCRSRLHRVSATSAIVDAVACMLARAWSESSQDVQYAETKATPRHTRGVAAHEKASRPFSDVGLKNGPMLLLKLCVGDYECPTDHKSSIACCNVGFAGLR
jgi:hypothetical protein